MSIPDAIVLCVFTVSWAAVMIAAFKYGGKSQLPKPRTRPSNHWFYETRPPQPDADATTSKEQAS